MFMPSAGGTPLWMDLAKIAGGILTLVVLYFLIKELRKVVKDSNEGRCSDKCDLD